MENFGSPESFKPKENTTVKSLRDKTRNLLIKQLGKENKRINELMEENDHLFGECVEKNKDAIANVNVDALDKLEEELAKDIAVDILSNSREKKELQEAA